MHVRFIHKQLNLYDYVYYSYMEIKKQNGGVILCRCVKPSHVLEQINLAVSYWLGGGLTEEWNRRSPGLRLLLREFM